MPLDKATEEWVKAAFTDTRKTDYETYSNYYDGIQGVEFTDRLKEFITVPEHEFSLNFCGVVCDAMAERLIVSGMECDDEALGTWIWDVWERNRMDAESRVVHTQAAILGDAYVIVDWNADEGRPTIKANSPELIRPRYNVGTGEMEWAAKRWDDGDMHYLTMYHPDRVERYERREDGEWTERAEDKVIPWTLGGDPVGIPVVHFRNKPIGRRFGTSELANIISPQDVLNKTLVDLIMVCDSMGFGLRYVIGAQEPAGGIPLYPGVVLNLQPFSGSDVTPSAGSFPAEDPNKLIAMIEEGIEDIAGITRTPSHILRRSGQGFPSGEALKTAEHGLLSKVRDRQTTYGNAWEDVTTLVRRVSTLYESAPPGAEDALIETQWEDTETQSALRDLQSAQALRNKVEGLGIPKEQAWREAGYSQEDIDRMNEDLEAQKLRDTNLGGELLKSFGAGEGGF